MRRVLITSREELLLGRRRRQVLVVGVGHVALGEVTVVAPQLGLGHVQRRGRQVQNSLDPTLYRLIEGSGLHHLVHQAPLLSPRPIDALAEHDHLAGPGHADLLEQPGRGSPAQGHPQLHLGVPEHGVPGRHPEIAGQRPHAAAPGRVTLKASHRGDVTVLNGPSGTAAQMGPPAGLPFGASRSQGLVVRLAVRPRAERQAPTAQHHHLGREVLLQSFEDVTHLRHHAGVDGVTSLWTVEPDVQDLGSGRVTFQLERLVGSHGSAA